MAGMKEGPGSDPFADDDDDPDESNNTVNEEPNTAVDSEGNTQPSSKTPEIPYAVRRQTVKEARSHELVIFARDEFQELEDDVRQAVADELGMSPGNVPVTDIREAYIEVARRNPDDMADVLLEWGYDHLR